MSKRRLETSLYTEELSNGVHVLALPMENTSTVSIVVAVRVGSRHDPPNGHGMAHLLEHMMMTTHANRPSLNSLHRELDSLGGESNAFTDKDNTMLTIEVRPQDVPRAIGIVLDIVQHLKWNHRRFMDEKESIISELRENEDDPEQNNHEELFKHLFVGSPLGHKEEGTAKSVASITNRALHTFKESYYCGANIVVSVVGAIRRNDIKKYFIPRLKEFDEGNGVETEKCILTQDEPKIITRNKGLAQLWLNLGFSFDRLTAQEIIVLHVITSMLGDNAWTSLFFSKIRGAGLVYSLTAESDAFSDVGYIAVRGSTSHAKDKEVVRAIFAILAHLKKNVSTDALQFFKDYLSCRYEICEKNTEFYAADVVEDCVRGLEIFTPQERINAIQSVTRREFLDITNKIFDFSRANLALLGPCRSPNVYRRIIEEFL